jgi:dolichol-phosphate mannosyltransferase
MTKKITILTPVFNEEANLPLYEKAVSDILLSCQEYDFQILFIDDGSTDRSWSIILDISTRNPHNFQGIRLSRNYGSHIALSAGFDNATDGEAIATLACDLQDPPEVILEFLEKWRAGAQIVWGKRRTREDKLWKILTSKIFSKLMYNYAMPRNSKFTTGSFLLVDKKVAHCFRQFRESNRITFALVAWTGFEQVAVDYDRRQRKAGKSGWNLSKMLKTAYDAFIGFSATPIRLVTWLGITTSLLGVPMLLYIVFSWLVGSPVRGYTSIMAIIIVFFSIQFFLMGLMGEYLYRIYAEAVRRPLYFVSNTTKLDSPERRNSHVN